MEDEHAAKRQRLQDRCPKCGKQFTNTLQLDRHKRKYKDGECAHNSGAAPPQEQQHHTAVMNRAASTSAAATAAAEPTTMAPPPAAQASASSLHPTDVQLLMMCRLANSGQGMPEADVQELLHFIQRMRDTETWPTITSLTNYKASLKTLQAELGEYVWEEHVISVTEQDVPGAGLAGHPVQGTFRMINLLEWLRIDFGNPEYRGNFVVEGKLERSADGSRSVSNATHCHHVTSTLK
jgi:hypothetical protein